MSSTSSAPDVAIVGDPTRLNRLDELLLLDTGPEQDLDRLTGLAARVTGAPVALLSVIDDERQYFKSAHGLADPWASQGETPLSHSFCVRVMVTNRMLAIDDTRLDPSVEGHPAIEGLGVGAYLGVPLLLHDGVRVGALCCIDDAPRSWTEVDRRNLEDLAAAAVNEIQARQLRADLVSTLEHVRHAEAANRRFHQLTSAALDTLDRALCVVDRTGVIIETNQRWDATAEAGVGMAAPLGHRLFESEDGGVNPYNREPSELLARVLAGDAREANLVASVAEVEASLRHLTIAGVLVGGRRYGVVSLGESPLERALIRH